MKKELQVKRMCLSPIVMGLGVANQAGQISVFDTAGAGKFVQNITVGTEPIDVAFTPNGKTACVTNAGANTVSVIDVKTSSVKGKPDHWARRPLRD